MRLTLTSAKIIVASTAVLLPVMLTRDEEYAHARQHAAAALTSRNAMPGAVARLDVVTAAGLPKEIEAAQAALVKLDDELTHHSNHASAARSAAAASILQLKKLTHPSDGGKKEAHRLAPRNARREAARLARRDERQEEQARKLVDEVQQDGNWMTLFKNVPQGVRAKVDKLALRRWKETAPST